MEGRPEILQGTKFSVVEEMNIPGNVDYETGNIYFNRDVNINGTILEGFEVKGVNITVKEIMGARLKQKTI